MVRITAEGVEEVDNGTDNVLFASSRTLAPWKLCNPVDPFAACDAFRGISASADHGRDLLQAWVYSFPTNPRSKPPLCASGDVGSGKTRTLKGVAELYGFPFVAAKVEESAENDFWPNMDSGGLLILDNADTRCRWLPDAIAAAATDGCSQRRKLYTNSETVTLRPRAWLAITTANPTFANDSGLADRLLIVRMQRRPGESSDSALTDQILAARDAGLSHIAQTLSKAMRDKAPVPGGLNSRHPDFAAFAVRIGRALGRESEMIAALQAAEADKSAFCLENDPIGSALLALVASTDSVEGTAAEIGPRLVAIDPELEGRTSPKRLGRRLGALWPHLDRSLLARAEKDRTGVIHYHFKRRGAGFAGFQTPPFPKVPLEPVAKGVLGNQGVETLQTPQPTSKELFDAAEQELTEIPLTQSQPWPD